MTVVELIILQNFVHLGDVQISTELQIICRSRGAIRVLAFKLERNNFDFNCERKKVLPMLLLQQYDVFQKRICILKEPTSTKSNGSIVAFVVLLFAWETLVLSLQLQRPTILYRKASDFTKREERRGTCKLYKAMALFSQIKNFKFHPSSERLVHACKENIGICDLICMHFCRLKKPGNELNISKQCQFEYIIEHWLAPRMLQSQGEMK